VKTNEVSKLCARHIKFYQHSETSATNRFGRERLICTTVSASGAAAATLKV